MHFGTYLVAFFCPPVYFLIRKRWLAAILNGTIYLVACFLLLSLILAVFAPIPWIFCMIHAMWNVRKQLATENAELLAAKMAERMRLQPVPTAAVPPSLPQR